MTVSSNHRRAHAAFSLGSLVGKHLLSATSSPLEDLCEESLAKDLYVLCFLLPSQVLRCHAPGAILDLEAAQRFRRDEEELITEQSFLGYPMLAGARPRVECLLHP